MKKSTFLFFASCLFAILIFSCSKGKASAQGGSDKEKVMTNDGSFYVMDMQPAGELPSAVKFPAVYVQFSKPVVPVAKLGESSSTSKFMKIEPALEGVYRWYGTSLLCFDSTEATLPQREYTVTLADDIVSVDGTPLSGEKVFAFRTQELKLLSITPGYQTIQDGGWVNNNDMLPEQARSIALFFSYPVEPKEISKSIVVTDEAGTEYAFTASQPDEKQPQLLVLTLKKAPPENNTITVTLKAGARSEPNALPTSTDDDSHKFHTLTPFVLKDVSTYRYNNSKYANPVTFRFSHRIAEEADLEKIAAAVATEPAMNVTKDNLAVSGFDLIVYGLPVTFGQIYKITIGANVISDVNGRFYESPCGPEEITVPEAASYVGFKDYGSSILEAQFPPKMAFDFQNIVPGSYYTVESLSGKSAGKTETVVLEKTDIPKNTHVIKTVDLSPFLNRTESGLFGAVKFNAAIDYIYTDYNGSKHEYTSRNEQIIQVTDLGMTVRYGYNRAIVVVTSLSTGKPVENATVKMFTPSHSVSLKAMIKDGVFPDQSQIENPFDIEPAKAVATIKTDKNGVAIVHFGKSEINPKTRQIFFSAEKDGDKVIFEPSGNRLWSYAARTRNPQDAQTSQQVTFMFTDRGLYKPGETLQLRGIDRTLTLGQYEPYRENYVLELAQNTWKAEPLARVQGTASESGGFTATFELPEDLTPGSYVINYRRTDSSGFGPQSISFTVAFFERLRFESSVAMPQMTYYSGDRVSADIFASYLGGGSLAGAAWYGNWYREPTSFFPDGKKYEGLTFGPKQGYDGRSALNSENGVLGESGNASTSQLSGGEKIQGRPYLYRMESTVTDAGGQAISANGSVVVHPAQYYIGLSGVKNKKGFPKKGDKLEFEYILVTPEDDSPTDGVFPARKDDRKIKVELLREDWKQVRQMGVNGQLITRYVREMVTEQDFAIDIALQGKVTVTPPKGGAYVLRLTGQDKLGRTAVTERSFYVSGSDWSYYYGDNSQEITLICDKDLYQVGDTAQIILQSPLPSGTYLMTVEREGIFSEELIQLTEPTSVLEVPISDRYLPVVYVTVSSYSLRTGEPVKDYSTPDLDKPKGYFGAVAVHVDKSARQFDITVKQDKMSYRPGETATVTLSATKDGQPLAGAELTLMAVDRGVIDLINYHVPNPVEYFYREGLFFSAVAGGDNRSMLMDPVLYESRNLYGGDAAKAKAAGDKMNERKNFDPTAVFVPVLVTGSDGTVTHSFKLPDNLTEYRLTAVGMLDSYFAITEDAVTVNNPVSVRDVLPRRLREGDLSDAGVVISNLDGKTHSVTVSMEILSGIKEAGIEAEEDGILRKAGKAFVKGQATKTVNVADGRTEPLMFDISAQENGFVTVIFTVKSDVINERIIKPLEIDRPYVFETVTTVGDVSSGDVTKKGKAFAEEAVVLPTGTSDASGTLFVSLDPTRLGTLTQAVSYVFRYPYGCLEQRCSSLIPLMYFGEYIDVFGLESEVSSPKKVIEAEIKSWASTQKPDGGFPYWRNSNYSAFGPTLRFAELIGGAKERGIKIPSSINIKALVGFIRDKALDNIYLNNSYIQAYSLYVISKLEDVTEAQIDKINDSGRAGFSEKALCGLMYLKIGANDKAKEVAKQVRSHSRPTTRGVDITDTAYVSAPWLFFNDEAERNALLLQFFTALDYADDMNGRLLHNLLQIQQASNGYWKNTASTARVLEAVAAYIKANNLENLNFYAEATLDGKPLVEGEFKGAASKPAEKTLEINQLFEQGFKPEKELPLKISKDGVGNLFYTVSMKYPIPAEEQEARDEGISVFVDIVDVKTGQIVADKKLKAGSIYKAKVTISTTKDRTFVAARIPIPSGSEVLNAVFATTEQFVGTSSNQESESEYLGDWAYYYDEYNFGLSSQDIYDNEVQYFWDVFRKGRQQVEFMFRAVRNGQFNVPSATAECMYEPEIFGRSNGGVFVISE